MTPNEAVRWLRLGNSVDCHEYDSQTYKTFEEFPLFVQTTDEQDKACWYQCQARDREWVEPRHFFLWPTSTKYQQTKLPLLQRACLTREEQSYRNVAHSKSSSLQRCKHQAVAVIGGVTPTVLRYGFAFSGLCLPLSCHPGTESWMYLTALSIDSQRHIKGYVHSTDRDCSVRNTVVHGCTHAGSFFDLFNLLYRLLWLCRTLA